MLALAIEHSIADTGSPIILVIDLFMSHEIARLPVAAGVVVNVVNPGLCVSEIRREMPWPIPCVGFSHYPKAGSPLTIVQGHLERRRSHHRVWG